MTVEIRPAQRTDADTLTAIAHAAKRSWRYPEEWIRLWSNELTVTPDFIERNRVCCAQRGGQVVGFYALSGTGSTRELEHMWVAPEHPGVGIGAALFEHAVETARAEGAPELRIASDPNAEGFYVKPVEEGEFIIVPRGIEHRPVADEECHVVLFEPATTLNTGDVQSELTVREPERI